MAFRADRYKWSLINPYKWPCKGVCLGLFHPYKWSYFNLLINGRGPRCRCNLQLKNNNVAGFPAECFFLCHVGPIHGARRVFAWMACDIFHKKWIGGKVFPNVSQRSLQFFFLKETCTNLSYIDLKIPNKMGQTGFLVDFSKVRCCVVTVVATFSRLLWTSTIPKRTLCQRWIGVTEVTNIMVI